MKIPYITIFITFLLCSLALNAQIERPVSWTFKLVRTSENQCNLEYSATFKQPWHIYSSEIPEGGPIPTTIHLNQTGAFFFVGKPSTNVMAIEKFDSLFMMKVGYFTQNVLFTQKITIKSPASSLSGYVEYMACDNSRCLPPEQENFTLKMPQIVEDQKSNDKNKSAQLIKISDSKSTYSTISRHNDTSKTQTKTVEISNPVKPHKTRTLVSLWIIFIGGFLGGLLAILTPCVFPMIPLTVSFFLKRGKKKNETGNAILYGLSIIFIYVGLGMFTTILFGPDAMNALSTNPWFNLFFFFLLVVFAASFLGAFELELPSNWSNYINNKADATSGLVSIFFMAFTLGLVSFSCTGPIIGTLLVEAATSGSKLGPIIGMFGFSLALALPFSVFALFPQLLKKLPRSGGWLNSIKIVLGFLEIALALKFLSTADLTAHWGILPRETFLSLWIVLFALLGFYLLGKLKFAHDSDVTHVTVTRLFLAIISFSFTIYMIPGLWGAPLKAISAFSPPQATQDFDLSLKSSTNVPSYSKLKKYGELFHCPLGLDCFFDYDEGMAYARQVKKPVLLDFTGHGCINCRKMEVSVWSDKKVLDIIANKYILISLYVDDMTSLPQNEQKEVTLGERTKKIKTIGNKWSYFQASHFGINSQPYYVLLDNEGKALTQPTAFDLNIDSYILFLQNGIAAFEKRNK